MTKPPGSDSSPLGFNSDNSENRKQDDFQQASLPVSKIKNKKSLLNKLIVAKRRYDHALKTYQLARKEYAKAKLEAETQEKLSRIQMICDKAAIAKVKRKEKFQELQRVVKYYFSNRSRQLG